MVRYGLLVLTSTCIETNITNLLKQASKEVRDVLYVDIYEPNNRHLRGLYELLVEVYGNNSSHIGHLDVRILLPRAPSSSSSNADIRHLSKKPEVAMVRDIFGNDQSNVGLFGFKKWVSGRFQLTDLDKKLKYLKEEERSMEPNGMEKAGGIYTSSLQTYNEIVLGGTFDHPHCGHRLLLGVASLLCEKRITVGLSEGPLLQRKVLKELIEPFSVRKRNLEEFFDDIKPGLEHNIVPLTDPVGPAGTGAVYQCLVASKETEKGGNVINNIRDTQGLDPLDVHVIDLVIDSDVASTTGKGEKEGKMSSTAERQKLLGTLLRPVANKEKVPGRPYVIGLTGGIACGKSSVCRRLEGLGAAVVNCDQLGHLAYAPGKKAYREIVENFGPGVLTPEKTINRKALGSIVFADKNKLALLNRIVWPEILLQIEEEISQCGQAGYGVCILDAAILLEAGWDSVVNEVWVVFVPESEALSRILTRDGLTEEQALNRIRSQLNIEERIAKANVAICTLWEPAYTQQQVEKAWKRLHKQNEQWQ